ncbi:unnamed protein product [Linum tenue]|uniref:Peroxidase n=1 Tax=Linum tenue TaxID=586396 RepID=A0AAV0S8D2_9ROSI|nr:unnamed protein product [Linum tenue]
MLCFTSMKMVSSLGLVPLMIALVASWSSTAVVHGQLKNGFYSSSCPKAEAIVRSAVESAFKDDPSIAPGLLRLHFHDCFVQGCDGSVLISGSNAERSAPQNLGIRGFEVIDAAKAQLEASCPGVVSCADILALAARDSVDLSNGPSWAVPTGRRDGRVSSASQAAVLPSPLDSIAAQRQKFAAKGLDDHDLVTLAGNFPSTKISSVFWTSVTFCVQLAATFTKLVDKTETLCPRNGNGLKKIPLDRDSHGNFDTSFFKNVKAGNGVLESDQRLWDDANTRRIVENYAGTIRGLFGFRFDFEFSKAMIKMSGVEVKTGRDGEIRKVCSRAN